MDYYILVSAEGDQKTETQVDEEQSTIIILTDTGFVRSGNTYTANGASEMAKKSLPISPVPAALAQAKRMIWKSCSEWTAVILMKTLLKR